MTRYRHRRKRHPGRAPLGRPRIADVVEKSCRCPFEVKLNPELRLRAFACRINPDHAQLEPLRSRVSQASARPQAPDAREAGGLRPDGARALHQPVLRLVRPLLKRGQASGAFNPDLPVDWMLTGPPRVHPRLQPRTCHRQAARGQSRAGADRQYHRRARTAGRGSRAPRSSDRVACCYPGLRSSVHRPGSRANAAAQVREQRSRRCRRR